MRLLPHPATESIQLTEVLRALSDPVRMEIVVRLAARKEQTCSGVGEELGVHKSTASHHYRTLREAGVVMTRQVGRLKFMRLRRDDLDARFPGLLDAVLAAAHADDTGQAAAHADDAGQGDGAGVLAQGILTQGVPAHGE
ncbi:ArsR/SmtB family transcription factor [Nonomuraea rhodomycinica]|uniref:Helix-turn-helix transcriptional regulator n=1 Tax=Nonomuraea rhodomycinica TaxID=1712872 RepID=A0A7Y6IXQ7_9ACTN|nr:helix-turn-helix transcriptional regulator [Nonomuraea rhodomycinica]NUW45981.1 helix-turn-helix transcriptional regulator [Nonomuraea rhodomycinica]